MAPFIPTGRIQFGPDRSPKDDCVWLWPPQWHLSPVAREDRTNPVDGLRDHSRPLALLHQNKSAGALRRLRHFDAALARLDLRARTEMADELEAAPPGAGVFRCGLDVITTAERQWGKAYRRTLWSVR